MKTRIKVVSSHLKTEYFPQYKGWFFWKDMQGTEAPPSFFRLLLDGIEKGYKPKTLDMAKYMIDRYVESKELVKIEKKHKKEAKTSYVKYP